MLWAACFIQKSSTAFRVIRSANASKFIHQDWEYTDVTEQPDPVDFCMNVSDSETGGNKRSVRSNAEEPVVFTTEPTNSVNESELSEEFKNCEHLSVEQGCYEVLTKWICVCSVVQNTILSH
ncbi:hypothetical protein TNIN_76671 [Trichonephila inaurata madagascariensis]|uniref:Uncharacterized protein n=1 Tax=Trichonephila inaurata madagascariensis TaxID=2747483 RepID=A0A8X6Y4K9_9ARAC|nr:hypothetical protein TNIN_76671 [Trichonephila inaurata madagascariensis]